MVTPIISVTLSEDGKIAIPEKLRKALDLNDGQSVTLRRLGQTILIEKGARSHLRARAEALVRQAKANVAQEALFLDADRAWAQYDAAAVALRKALQGKRPPKQKRLIRNVQ